ncbi:hypothetical protein ACHQM5_019800 [Ranunculus cassubicifolius]
MNDLFSRSFPKDENDIEMGAVGSDLDNFFKEVDGVKLELDELENLRLKLQSSHQESQSLHNAKSVKELRSRMDSDISQALRKAKSIKLRLEAIDRSNAANRLLPDSGPGSSSDRTRTSIANGLKKKLLESMDSFNKLREKISAEYKETVERRYYTVTGEKADENTIENLIATGESETFMQRVIQEQGRGQVVATISEIQERHSAVKEIERGLQELHQVFLDISVLVEAQGESLDNIESHVARANSYIRGGTKELQIAKKKQRSTRKWTCFCILLLLIILLIIILPIVLK